MKKILLSVLILSLLINSTSQSSELWHSMNSFSIPTWITLVSALGLVVSAHELAFSLHHRSHRYLNDVNNWVYWLKQKSNTFVYDPTKELSDQWASHHYANKKLYQKMVSLIDRKTIDKSETEISNNNILMIYDIRHTKENAPTVLKSLSYIALGLATLLFMRTIG